jgi:hypothetical protein
MALRKIANYTVELFLCIVLHRQKAMPKPPLDPFEQYEHDREANLQRMRREKRLNVVRGSVHLPPATPRTKRPRRIPLVDKTNEANSNTTEPNFKEAVMHFHRTLKRAQQADNAVSLLDLVKQSRSKFRVSKERLPTFRSYDEISRALTSHTPTNELSSQVKNMFQNYIGWFADNRFEFQLSQPPAAEQIGTTSRTSEKSPELENHSKEPQNPNAPSILQLLLKKRYVPSHLLRQPKSLPAAAQKLESFNRIGQFLISATICHLESSRTETVLLAAPSLTIDLEVGVLLALPKFPDTSVTLAGSNVAVYTTWHVYSTKH